MSLVTMRIKHEYTTMICQLYDFSHSIYEFKVFMFSFKKLAFYNIKINSKLKCITWILLKMFYELYIIVGFFIFSSSHYLLLNPSHVGLEELWNHEKVWNKSGVKACPTSGNFILRSAGSLPALPWPVYASIYISLPPPLLLTEGHVAWQQGWTLLIMLCPAKSEMLSCAYEAYSTPWPCQWCAFISKTLPTSHSFKLPLFSQLNQLPQ